MASRRLVYGLTALIIVVLAGFSLTTAIIIQAQRDAALQQQADTRALAECILNLLLIPIDIRYELPPEEIAGECAPLADEPTVVVSPDQEPVSTAPVPPAPVAADPPRRAVPPAPPPAPPEPRPAPEPAPPPPEPPPAPAQPAPTAQPAPDDPAVVPGLTCELLGLGC